MSEAPTERRRFHRIATDKPLTVWSGAAEHQASVLDVSLRGLLFELGTDWRPVPGEKLRARLQLDGAACCIELQGEVAHIEGSRIGLRCTSIDLESASRLRRMVELNLADTALLERDLAQLIGA